MLFCREGFFFSAASHWGDFLYFIFHKQNKKKQEEVSPKLGNSSFRAAYHVRPLLPLICSGLLFRGIRQVVRRQYVTPSLPVLILKMPTHCPETTWIALSAAPFIWISHVQWQYRPLNATCYLTFAMMQTIAAMACVQP